jgi:hypothetical protein
MRLGLGLSNGPGFVAVKQFRKHVGFGSFGEIGLTALAFVVMLTGVCPDSKH